jgi:acyl-lipid (8-3)-desaturase
MCVSGKGVQAQIFSQAEVAVHNTPSDCWLVIHGKVYDVTSYIARHPGGAMIYVKAGRDCSHLFDSYHTSARAR